MRIISATGGMYRYSCATQTMPAALLRVCASRSISTPSSMRVTSGFSIRMCRSVASASRMISMWVKFGVAITTASHRPLASRARWSWNTAGGFTGNAAAAMRLAGCVSEIAVTSAASSALMFSMCSRPMLPQPMTP